MTELLPMVSVIMPVRNEKAYIAKGLKSVLAQNYPADRLEIIVADGMSDDGTREIVQALQKIQPNIRLIDNPGMIVSPGLNLGIKASSGEIVVRIDGHCEIAPDYVRNCVHHLQVGGADGVGGPIETIGEDFLSGAIAKAMSSRFGVGGSAFRVGTEKAKFVDTVAFPAYTRSILEKAGLFDEELVRNQDDEYNYRLRKMGCRLLLAPDVRSQYYSRASLPKLWSQYFQYGFWKIRVLQKHPRQMSFRQFVPPLFVLAMLSGLTAALFFQDASILALFAGAYLTVNFIVSILISAKTDFKNILILPVIFIILHCSYGAGFISGIFQFRKFF